MRALIEVTERDKALLKYFTILQVSVVQLESWAGKMIFTVPKNLLFRKLSSHKAKEHTG